MLPKLRIIWKNTSNKKNSVGAYVYLPPGVELGLQKLLSLKYYNAQKWESRFTLELNAAKNMHYIKKCFK